MHYPKFPGARGVGVAVLAGTLALGTSALMSTAASAAGAPLPPYPATTTLDLGSQNCVTDSVIMNDPITSPITVTYGSDGNPVVQSHAKPPVVYTIWYLNTNNVWTFGAPPGVKIDSATGVISSNSSSITPITSNTSTTWTVRVHGEDSVHAKGTEQFQINVDNAGGTSGTTSVTYEGNDFDNANAELTIQLNDGSNDSTALTLNPVASSLGIPGSTPVTFELVNSPGWTLSGNNVLTGVNASDPEFKATTTGSSPTQGPHDVVFFTLSGISTDNGGVFYTNTDVNPCVSIQNVQPSPPPTVTPPPPTSTFGDFVNNYGNGFDVRAQGAWSNNAIIGWPAWAGDPDPAVHFLKESEGSNFRLEYAPNGFGDGLCVSNPGDNALVLRPCNTFIWQQLYVDSSGHVRSAVNQGYVNPFGKGNQLTVGGAPTPWGGSVYHWVDNA